MSYANAFLIAGFLLAMATFEHVEGKKMSIADARKAMQGVKNVCIKKSGASPDLVATALQGPYPDDEKYKCFVNCVLTMAKVVKDNKFRPDVMRRQIELMLFEPDAERMIVTIDACTAPALAASGCEAGWIFCKCFYETDREMYLLP